MVHINHVKAQLKNIGVTVKSWGAAEMHELPHILMPNEQITNLIHGWYENGFATLVTTDLRLLLVDKKMFNLTLEDIRYDMVAEVEFKASVLDSTMCITTINKKLKFSSFKQKQLRDLTTYVQQRVMELRQPNSWAQFEEIPVPEVNPELQSYFVPQPDAQAVPGRPLVPILNKLTPRNTYPKASFTTKHNTFLPRVPRRFRPTIETQV